VVVLGAERVGDPLGGGVVDGGREAAVAGADRGRRDTTGLILLEWRVEGEQVVAELFGKHRLDVPVTGGEVDGVEFAPDLDAGAGRHHHVPIVAVLEGARHRGAPAVYGGLVGVFDAVDVVQQQEVGSGWRRVFDETVEHGRLSPDSDTEDDLPETDTRQLGPTATDTGSRDPEAVADALRAGLI
jgi:hypothetical protein